MALLPRFDPPAFLTDVPAGSPFYVNWSNFISGLIGGITPGSPAGAFYNPTTTDVNIAGEKKLTWMGFPRDQILPGNRDDRVAAYVQADSFPVTRRYQNEYFEWRVDRNAAGKIRKLTFVTEMPEYYDELWRVSPAAVLAIYRNLVNPGITLPQLRRPDGSYDKMNRWNTTDGIVHYIQSINTLRAAIGLSKSAVNSAPPTNDNYDAFPALAGATTSVDPRVSYDVHMLTRKGLYVTLKNPIGLYIAGWDDSGITKPGGGAAGNYWRIVRGVPGMVLRLEYEVPAGLGFVVGDLKIGGRPIEYGGQLAELITVTIAGVAGTTGRG